MDDSMNPTTSEVHMPSEHTPLLLPSPPPSICNLPWYRRPNPLWVLVPTFWITIYGGAFMAPFVQWVEEIVCEYRTHHAGGDGIIGSGSLPLIEECATPEVQAFTSMILMMYNLTTAILALGSTSYLTALSDIRGRRFLLIVSSLGMTLTMATMIIISRFWRTLPIYFVLIPAVIDGFCGGPVTLLSGISAYIADCTTREERNIVFGRMSATAFLGQMIGPTIGGYLMNNFGSFESVAIFGFIVMFFWFLFALFLLPESNPYIRPDNADPIVAVSMKSSFSNINTFGALSVLFTARSPYVTSTALPLIISAHFLSIFGVYGATSIYILYLLYRFHWDTLQAGVLISFQNGTKLTVLLVALPAVIYLCKQYHSREKSRRMEARQQSTENVTEDDNEAEEELHRDQLQEIRFNLTLVRFGLATEAIYYFTFGLATAGWQLFALSPFNSGSSVYSPAVRSLVTHLVEPTQTGAVMGALSVAEAAANLLGTIVFNVLYSQFVYTNPSVPFYVTSAVACASFACMLMVMPVMGPPKTPREETA